MIGFGSIGGGEILVLLVLALLLFGPRRIPEIGRTIGKTLAEFRKATSDLKVNLEREIQMEKIGEATEELREARTDLKNLAREATSMETSPHTRRPRAEIERGGPEKEQAEAPAEDGTRELAEKPKAEPPTSTRDDGTSD